jgi:hypothetical protein
MKLMYVYRSRAGYFQIEQRGRNWQLCHGDDCFDGPYDTPDAALEELVNGYSAWPSCGDPSTLGLPDDLSDWELIRA